MTVAIPTRNKLALLILILIAIASCGVFLLFNNSTSSNETQTPPTPQNPYVGLTIKEATDKARSESRSYKFYTLEQKPRFESEAIKEREFLDSSYFGLIMFTDNGIVVEAEHRVDPKLESYIGMTENEAIAKAKEDGYRYRVIIREQEGSAITLDLRKDRVNLFINNGVVVDIYFT